MMTIRNSPDMSVKFNRTPDMGFENQKAFPFVYTFVNASDNTWVPSGSSTISLSNIGPTIPKSSKITHNVRLDADYNFKLLSIRYTAYTQNIAGSYYNYLTNNGYFDENNLQDVANIGYPVIRDLDISLSLLGSGSKMLYGGDDTGPLGNGRRPMKLELMQGYDSGHMVVRTPYLLPTQAILSFEINNRNTTLGITLGAAIYGMKIRL